MREKTLKLYIWEGVLCDYYCGMIVALAHSIEEARKIVKKTDPYIKYYLKDLDKNPRIIYLTKNTRPVAFTVYGHS